MTKFTVRGGGPISAVNPGAGFGHGNIHAPHWYAVKEPQRVDGVSSKLSGRPCPRISRPTLRINAPF